MLTGRRLPTFLNSNFFVPRRMFSTCSGLIDNKSFNVHLAAYQWPTSCRPRDHASELTARRAQGKQRFDQQVERDRGVGGLHVHDPRLLSNLLVGLVNVLRMTCRPATVRST
jgi:hypothetical protein